MLKHLRIACPLQPATLGWCNLKLMNLVEKFIGFKVKCAKFRVEVPVEGIV